MRYAIIIILLTVAISSFSQSEEGLKKIEQARIALISERLKLTPEQAEKFWPLYREYLDRRQGLRAEYQKEREASGRQLTDEESKRLLEKGLDLKQRQLELDRNYSERLNTVISNRQILQLRKAEDDFRQMLLERLDRRNEQRERLNRREERKNNEN